MKTRKCKQCGETKPIEEFTCKNEKYWEWTCKACKAAQSRKRNAHKRKHGMCDVFGRVSPLCEICRNETGSERVKKLCSN